MKKHLLWPLLLFGTAHAAPLQVSATTSLIADFVQQVGGQRVKVNVIVPAGADAHTFAPSTGAIRSLAGSKLLFANGAGLEPWLPRLRAAAPRVPVRELTTGLKLRAAGHATDHAEHGAYDPHAWWDASLAAGYVKNVQVALSAADPAGKASYARNAAAYLAEIRAADTWAKKQFAALPASKRQVVTHHDSLGYFARRYGLTVIGAVIPGLSTEREPSARELATLVGAVKKSGAKVILTENTVSARLAQTLARETGARIAPALYTDALGPQGSVGSTYLKALKHNVRVVVQALEQGQ